MNLSNFTTPFLTDVRDCLRRLNNSPDSFEGPSLAFHISRSFKTNPLLQSDSYLLLVTICDNLGFPQVLKANYRYGEAQRLLSAITIYIINQELKSRQ